MSTIVEVKIPEFSGTSEKQEAKIMFWFKAEGEEVQKGDELVEIETDKAIFDMESPATGRIKRVINDAGDTVLPGQKIGEIEIDG